MTFGTSELVEISPANPLFAVCAVHPQVDPLASEVLGWRVLQLFMFVMKESLERDEIEERYFKLHFYARAIDELAI